MSEAILSMYSSLMEIGLTQNEIDDMDIIYYLKLLAHKKNNANTDNKSAKAEKSQPLTIDQILG